MAYKGPYKVLKSYRHNRILVSLIVGAEAGVIYGIGEPAYAPPWLAERGYHLTVFRTLKLAKRYRSECARGFYYNRLEVWRVSAKSRIQPLPTIMDWRSIERGLIIPYVGYCSEGVIDWPEGTEMYEEITLLERVA